MQTDLIKYFEIITIKFKIPLYAAGAVKREKIEKLEAQLRRKQLQLPNDIKSNKINSIYENFSTQQWT